MGNPLSPLLAEIFVDNLEKQIFNHPLSKRFLYWHRYVDDIITCFSGTNRQLDQFLSFINNLHPKIKFTVELEDNKSINFLDLTITNKNDSHEFSIFHKPSHTDTVIHNKSNHPYSHKMASFNSFVHRLLNVPLSSENYKKELNIIKQVAVNNGYNAGMVDDLVKKKAYKKAINLVYPTTNNTLDQKFKSITYTGNITKKISKTLSKNKIKTAFRTNNNLGKLIKNNKSKPNKLTKSGVYLLECGSCPKMYIGQTGRSFKTRIKEHESSFLKNNNLSHYALHLNSEKHNFSKDFKILHTEKKSKKLNYLESMEINKKKRSGLLLNEQLDTNYSPLLNLYKSTQ